jgi:uncharacterized protein (DUF1015 family)
MYHVFVSCVDLGHHRDAGDNIVGNTLNLQVKYGNYSCIYTVVMETGLEVYDYFKLLHYTWPHEKKNSVWIEGWP